MVTIDTDSRIAQNPGRLATPEASQHPRWSQACFAACRPSLPLGARPDALDVPTESWSASSPTAVLSGAEPQSLPSSPAWPATAR